MTSRMFRYDPDYGFVNDDPMQRSAEEIFSKFGDMIDKASTISDSSTKWTSVTIIACSITITMVVLKWLLKKEHTTITAYSPIPPANMDRVSLVSDQHISVTVPPVPSVVPFSQILGETVEKFLEGIARERPIRFSCQDINELTCDLSTRLGVGGYGEVYEGRFTNGVMIAVKVLKDKQHTDKKIQEQFMSEVGILARTHHVNLVRLYGFCFDPTMRALVYEHMENRSLDKLLFDKNKAVPWQTLCQIAIGIAKGLSYLHEDCQQKIIHYDIKPENILLDSKLNPKVADFGLARLCNKESNEESSQEYTAHGGTLKYVAPECHIGMARVTYKCDVYSFGLLLMEIITRRRNYVSCESTDDKEDVVSWTWKLYKKGKLLNFFLECGIEKENMQEAHRMLEVVFLCVHHNPNKRPIMSNVVKMLEGEKDIIQHSNPFDYDDTTISDERSSARSEIELAS